MSNCLLLTYKSKDKAPYTLSVPHPASCHFRSKGCWHQSLHANQEAEPWCGWEHKSGFTPKPRCHLYRPTFCHHERRDGPSVYGTECQGPQEDCLCCYLACSSFHSCGLESPNRPGIVTWYVSSKEKCQSSVSCIVVFITFSKSSEDGDVGHFLCDYRFDEGKP